MSTALLLLCFEVSFAIPSAHLPYVCIGVGGCGWPSSTRIVRMNSTSFALWKIAPRSASVAEERTLRIMVERTRISPLMGEGWWIVMLDL